MKWTTKILEFEIAFDADIKPPRKITKRQWIKVRDLVQTEMAKISHKVWENGNKKEIGQAISKAIYTLTALACEADMMKNLNECLHEQHNKMFNAHAA